MQPDPNEAELDWPLAPGETGREVWYSLVGPRDGSAAFWYRFTLLATEGGRREGRLWAALTDREAPEHSTFVTTAVPLEDVRVGTDPFRLAIGDGELTSSSATGHIDGEVDVAWDLSFEPDTYMFTPLRSQKLTEMLARTMGTGKHWSRNESVYMTGEVTVGDRTLELEAAPGHQGHTLSSEPPDDWTWVQCNGFDTSETAADELVLEALQLDDYLSICFRRDEEVYPLNTVKHVAPMGPAANAVERNEVGYWRFSGSGDGLELQATVEADPDHWQRVAYCLPDDSLRYNAHCSISRVTVTYTSDGVSTTVASDAGRAEWVGIEPPVEGVYRPEWG